jgi:hypothetical protein
MERVMMNPVMEMPGWSAKPGYYLNLPCQYHDLYLFKLMRINEAVYAAEEQALRVMKGLEEIRRPCTK